ncbi:hypothetical protein OQH61_03615 [Helicobacter sp. MIT 21-1697]|uniref:hypothetical protein n=1 Tax=Helicobacter sp. MIT 21-1697 TaxID=2993733 RepID=UPI00224AFE3A|nr:hypothetical protein [Helicobacter sp. MIT 21-1697]MCX2716822.1 hypothetical protein [Helicobacter sp. MIT 21-1697]
MKKLLSMCLLALLPTYSFCVASIVESPSLLAQMLKSYEQYKQMIEKANEQVNRLNEINNMMNSANNLMMKDGLKIADPREVLEKS